jgi:hypothetical protein
MQQQRQQHQMRFDPTMADVHMHQHAPLTRSSVRTTKMAAESYLSHINTRPVQYADADTHLPPQSRADMQRFDNIASDNPSRQPGHQLPEPLAPEANLMAAARPSQTTKLDRTRDRPTRNQMTIGLEPTVCRDEVRPVREYDHRNLGLQLGM